MDILQKNKLLTLLVTVLIIINIALIASFWIFNDKHENGNPNKEKTEVNNIIDFFKIELAFNPAQSDSIEKLFKNYLVKSNEMREKIRRAHNEINNKVLKNINTYEVKNEFENLGNKKAELDKMSYEFFYDLRSLCNEEQKGKFDNLFKDIIRLINKPLQKK
jgi:periplasmic protein CpxP/Spy